ncbi:MAG: hypothetical protein GX833_01910 [Clostridium sp.]|nr:hypothetical protein [Clostridium sp.]
MFRVSSLLNIAWIVLFSFLFIELSVIFILGFVMTLALISLKLLKMQTSRRWLLPLTFGLYTGWLMIATVVNIASALVKLEWGRFGVPEDIWAMIVLAVSVGLVILVLLRIKNAAFPLPVAWAYFGIYQFLNAPDGFKGEYELLQIVTLVGCVVLIGAAAIQLYRNRFQIIPVQSGL